MARSAGGEPRGILNPKVGEKKFQLSRLLPSEDLKFFVEHYWIVKWDLRGQEPYLSENLPYPTVHLVIEKEKSNIFGVITGKFSVLIKEKGQVFGIKFRPGAFYPFVKTPVSRFTDRFISLSEVFGADALALETLILSVEDEEEMINIAENFLRERLPEHDENVAEVNRIIDSISGDGTIIKVDDLVERLKLNKRWLQRLFNHYVGVSPKWVIKRYRLHEAAQKLAHGEVKDWFTLALDLGYFDQAHFINDFKAIVGETPAEYARHNG
ncbi:MAG TPA: helix-turn-helix transcriptional regulator [Ktedonosporobacter sp.]|nr:helix-turn-helix transcriptional regulator [Ktedonosporobacter sp.]